MKIVPETCVSVIFVLFVFGASWIRFNAILELQKNTLLSLWFFLPSAPGIAFIFLFISSTLSIKNNYKKLANDKWNLVFIFSKDYRLILQ